MLFRSGLPAVLRGRQVRQDRQHRHEPRLQPRRDLLRLLGLEGRARVPHSKPRGGARARRRPRESGRGRAAGAHAKKYLKIP